MMNLRNFIAKVLDIWYVRDPLDPRTFPSLCTPEAASDPAAWLRDRGLHVEVTRLAQTEDAMQRDGVTYLVAERGTGCVVEIGVSLGPEPWSGPNHVFITMPHSKHACPFAKSLAETLSIGTRGYP